MPPEIIARDASRRATAGSGATGGGEAARQPAAVAIRVNGEPRSVPPGCTVAALLERLGIERRRVAVAVDREVVPRSALATRVLRAGDRVEILEAVGGG